MVQLAVQAGFDAEVAARDPGAVVTWAEEQLCAYIDGLPEEERAEYVAAYGDPRDDRRLPDVSRGT